MMAPGMAPGLAVLAGLTALLQGCSDPVTIVQGTGSMVQERRLIRPTAEIGTYGPIDLTVEVGSPGEAGVEPWSSGKDSVVWVEAPEDLIQYVETVLVGDALVIRVREGFELDPVPSVEVHMSRLTTFSCAGSGSVNIVSHLPADAAPELLTLSSTGSVDIEAAGFVRSLDLTQAGSGDMHLLGLRAETVSHTAAGSGDAWIFASKAFETTIAGSCSVHLGGAPKKIVKTILGRGEIIPVK